MELSHWDVASRGEAATPIVSSCLFRLVVWHWGLDSMLRGGISIEHKSIPNGNSRPGIRVRAGRRARGSSDFWNCSMDGCCIA